MCPSLKSGAHFAFHLNSGGLCPFKCAPHFYQCWQGYNQILNAYNRKVYQVLGMSKRHGSITALNGQEELKWAMTLEQKQ